MAGEAFIHPTAVVDEGARLGAGVKVWHFTHVCAGAEIGEGCNLGQNVYIAPTARLGRNVKVQNNVSIYDGVEIGDDAFCGPSMVFTNVVTPRAHISRRSEYGRTRVGRGATIGANATIVCGHDLGAYAFVAAGAVVTKDVAAYALVAGVPARQIGWMCACGERLALGPDGPREEAACARCGARYVREAGRLGPQE